MRLTAGWFRSWRRGSICGRWFRWWKRRWPRRAWRAPPRGSGGTPARPRGWARHSLTAYGRVALAAADLVLRLLAARITAGVRDLAS